MLNALREREGGAGLTLVDLFRLPTVAAITSRLDRSAGAPADETDSVLDSGG